MHASRGPSSSLTISRIFVSSQVSLTFLATNSFIFLGSFSKIRVSINVPWVLVSTTSDDMLRTGHPLKILFDYTGDIPIYCPVQGTFNLMSKGRPCEIESGRPQDIIRTFPRGPSKHVFGTMWGHLLHVSKFLFTFLSKLIRLTKST